MKARLTTPLQTAFRICARISLTLLALLTIVIAPVRDVFAQDAAPSASPVAGSPLCYAPAPGDNNGTISGTVTDKATGDPIRYVRVVADEIYGRGYDAVSTDAQGAYTLDGLYPGDYTLLFDTDSTSVEGAFISQLYGGGTSLANAIPLHIKAGDALTGHNAQLSMGAQISGTVTDSATHQPIGGVLVYLYSASDLSARLSLDLTNNQGNYEFSLGLAPGDYLLEFFDIDYKRAWNGGVDDAEDATPITIVGTTNKVFDQALVAGSSVPTRPSGTIKGRLTEFATGNPLVQGALSAKGVDGN